MKIEDVNKLRGILELLLEHESRTNEAKPIRYWYPLSLATYGTDEILEALHSMCSFRTSMAEKTLNFERAFARWQGAADAVMVNSGSSADLLLALLLTDPRNPLLAPGDEVLVPIVTWPTQVWSLMMAGLKVKFVDVDPSTLNIDLEDLEHSIGPETRALSLVHLMGNPCDMDRIKALAKKHKLRLVEDCCEAMGATWDGKKVGNFSLGGAFSFFFSHHITSMEGGMVAVSDLGHAEQLRILRAHGWVRDVDKSRFRLHEYPGIDPRYAFVNWGLNVRPTDVQAGFGMQQLLKADGFAKRRHDFAGRVRKMIDESAWLAMPKVLPKAMPSWLAIPIMVAANAPFTKQALCDYLEGQGIETRPIVTGNIARHPVAELFPGAFRARGFPGADQVHDRGFYIGLSPLQTDANVDRLIETFDQFLRRY